MLDVITVGSATRDIFINVNFLKMDLCLEPGSKFDIEKPFVQTGGGATNTAVSFSRLGLKTGILTRVGNDEYGHLIFKSLKKEGVDTKFLQYDQELSTAIAIVMEKQNIDRIVFVHRGASENINLNRKLDSKWLYISALRGNSLKKLLSLLNYARKNKIKIAMNPGSKELEMPQLLKYVDVLILNYEESAKLSGKREINEILKKLNNLGPKIIVITNGIKPLHVLYYNNILKANPIKSKIISTLGAGDAFGSAFVACLIKNKSIDEAIRTAILNAGSVIKYKGAKTGLLREDEINYSKIKNIEVKSLNFS